MSRWLARLRDEEKNTKTLSDGTDKTDETPCQPVLSVLSVRQRGECENFSKQLVLRSDPAEAIGDTVSTNAKPTHRTGIIIRDPAIEVSAAVYDLHLGALIATAGVDTDEGRRLIHVRRKGSVVARGSDFIFTRGRA